MCREDERKAQLAVVAEQDKLAVYASTNADAVMPPDEQQQVLSLEESVEARQRTEARDKQKKATGTVPGAVPLDDVAEADCWREASLDTVRGRAALEGGDLDKQGCYSEQKY